ncbi:DUF402 domain-containing protein [Nocardia sp. NBC_00565]|uniref:DUF402 domain-containing protein n=1 Tax=Nocardia sp. NBC_00565 TaxID=2975993 RepID=UPI002E80A580|nr:hypothetical protein [Nocardia sp. NBC_00565]WUC04528.1 DUF402 domain-containing protein [Nocardia sp. NBC_00565]
MSALIPLLAAAPAVTGIAGYVARDFRGLTPVHQPTTTVAPGPPMTTQLRPQVEHFNIAELTMTDPKGYVRPIDRVHVEPWGLYVARTVNGPRIQYLETWLLPELWLRVTIAHYQTGHHRDQDYCLHIGEYTRVEPKRWKSMDQYLEIAVRHGRTADLRGVDELLAAHAAGLIDTDHAHRALDRATTALASLAAHGHEVESWLATREITLTWM